MMLYSPFLALGYYKGYMKDLKWSPAQLVQEMNDFVRHGLLYEQGHSQAAPPMLARTVGKMQLKVSRV